MKFPITACTVPCHTQASCSRAKARKIHFQVADGIKARHSGVCALYFYSYTLVALYSPPLPCWKCKKFKEE